MLHREREPDSGQLDISAFLRACVDHEILPGDKAQIVTQFCLEHDVGVRQAMIDLGMIDDAAALECVSSMVAADDRYQNLVLNRPIDSTLTFESFVYNNIRSNPASLIRNLIENHRVADCFPLYVYGGVGGGKTHFLHAIANALPADRVTVVNALDLGAEVERAKRLQMRAELWRSLGGLKTLLIDDIQACAEERQLQIELLGLVDFLISRQCHLVFSGPLPPAELPLDDRLASRISSGLVIPLPTAQQGEKQIIVHHLNGTDALSSEMIDNLVSRSTGDIRLLKGEAQQMIALGGGGFGGGSDAAEIHGTGRFPTSAIPAAGPSGVDEMPRSEASRKRAITEVDLLKESRVAPNRAFRFKEMLDSAENEEEQALALQIALGERLREMKEKRADAEVIEKLESALELIRDGRIEEAMKNSVL